MAKDKDVVVSFRVDQHLSDVLNKVPDKSAFIRDLILRSYYQTCPVCRGRGVLPEELSRWAAERLKDDHSVECSCCLYGYPRPTLPNGKSTARDKDRFLCPHCETHDHGH